MTEPDLVIPKIEEAEDQMRKAGVYFGRVLRFYARDRLAARVDDVVIVVAQGDAANRLTELVEGGDEPFLKHGVSVDPESALDLRYHVPTSQTWQGSRGAAKGNVHLHVKGDVTLGRRKRKAGECLCSKKHGTYERPPDPTDTNLCPECVRVAETNGLVVPPLPTAAS